MGGVDNHEGCEDSGKNGVSSSTITDVSAVESKFSKLSLNRKAHKTIANEESKAPPPVSIKLNTIPMALDNNISSEWELAGHRFENITTKLTSRLWPRPNQQRSVELSKAIKDFKTHELHELDNQGKNFLNVLDIPLESDEVLQLYFDRFNSIFFDNALTPNICYKRWVLCSSEKWIRDMSRPGMLGTIVWGQTFYVNPFPEKQHPVGIVLYEHKYLKTMKPGQTLSAYLGTLLHEMLHAFFKLFGISAENDNAYCGTNFWMGCGGTGHGWHWQKTAYEMEKLCSEELDLKIKLGDRLGSLRKEILKMREGYYTEPTSSTLTRDNIIEEIGFKSTTVDDAKWIEYSDQTSNDWIHNYCPGDYKGTTPGFLE